MEYLRANVVILFLTMGCKMDCKKHYILNYWKMCFEKSVQKQMEELISLNLYRRARMAMQENGNSEPENDAEQELLERLHRKSDR